MKGNENGPAPFGWLECSEGGRATKFLGGGAGGTKVRRFPRLPARGPAPFGWLERDTDINNRMVTYQMDECVRLSWAHKCSSSAHFFHRIDRCNEINHPKKICWAVLAKSFPKENMKGDVQKLKQIN